MPDLYAPAGRDFVDRCHSNPLCKFVCKFCAVGCVLWRFLVVLCGVLRLFLRYKTSNFSDFIVLRNVCTTRPNSKPHLNQLYKPD